MGITVENYEARTEGILTALDSAYDMLYLLDDELDKAEGATDEEDTLHFDLAQKTHRARRNLEIAKENVEIALDRG